MAKRKSNRVADPPAAKSEKVDYYAGVSLSGAQTRLRDLIEEACQVLPIETLCHLSYFAAVYLDSHLDDYGPWKKAPTPEYLRDVACARENAKPG